MAFLEFSCKLTLITLLLCTVKCQLGTESSPWLVFLRSLDEYKCVGSLITDQFVLTTATCVDQLDINDTVAFLHVRNLTDENPGEVNRTVEDVLCEGDLPSESICLLKLSTPVNFTDDIQAVCLASENSTFYNGTTTSAIVLSDSESGTFTLQEEDASVVGNNQCNCDFLESDITEDLMCAQFSSEDYDACQVVTGSPLVSEYLSDTVLAGIYDGNSSDCGSVGVFIRISDYQKWIQSHFETDSEPHFVSFTSPGPDMDEDYECSASPSPLPTDTDIYPATTTSAITDDTTPTTTVTTTSTGTTSTTTDTTTTSDFETTTDFPFHVVTDDTVFGASDKLGHTPFFFVLTLLIAIHTLVGLA